MKTVLVVALVVIILLSGLPVMVGMSDMTTCSSCPVPNSPILLGMCFGALAGLVFVLGLFMTRVSTASVAVPRVLLARRLDKPPRLA
ncbi:MAG: hypothetical protein H0U16_05745 [Actinobacteria bacterium]|nr:hypothetical protein [Actinomycetota bacterium]